MPRWVAGVDEVGRGPLAGPVVAAAVILDPAADNFGLADSKKLSPRRRQELAKEVRSRAVAWALGRAEPEEIDDINILQASLLAMRRAVLALPISPYRVQVDGNHCPKLACHVEAVVGGDAIIACISAASILAKVSRDAEMVALAERFPMYGFDQHKGYPTALHRARLREYGPCESHRRSFRPVQEVIVTDDDRCPFGVQ